MLLQTGKWDTTDPSRLSVLTEQHGSESNGQARSQPLLLAESASTRRGAGPDRPGLELQTGGGQAAAGTPTCQTEPVRARTGAEPWSTKRKNTYKSIIRTQRARVSSVSFRLSRCHSRRAGPGARASQWQPLPVWADGPRPVWVAGQTDALAAERLGHGLDHRRPAGPAGRAIDSESNCLQQTIQYMPSLCLLSLFRVDVQQPVAAGRTWIIHFP